MSEIRLVDQPDLAMQVNLPRIGVLGLQQSLDLECAFHGDE